MTNALLDDLTYIVDSIPCHFTGMNDANIFLTGGTGFIGKWLLESFVFANQKRILNVNVTVLTRDSSKFLHLNPIFANHPNIHFLNGDIRSFTFPEGKFKYIIHAATEASAALNVDDPLLMSDVIVEGTRCILNFARHCQAERILFLSSGAVYGIQPEDIKGFREDFTGAPDPLGRGAAYAESKRMAEFLCATYSRQYGLPVSIARCFAFVGPYLSLDKHYAIGNFINDGLNGRDITITGDGFPLRSYMYASDLVTWLWTLLLHGNTGEAYNIGSERSVSIKDLASIVASFFPEIKVTVLNQVKSTDRNQNYIPNTEKARLQFHFKNEISLEEAISKTINYYKSI